MAKEWRRRRGAALVLLLLLVGCAGPEPLQLIAPTPSDLVRRHYDQVCRVSTREPPTMLATELLDFEGVSAELETVGAHPLPMVEGASRTEWGTADFVVRYGRDGRPEASGVWEASVDETAASAVGRILTSRLRTLPGLLQTEGFRIVVTLSRPARIEAGPPIVCSPHVRHPEGGRAFGLPEGVMARLESPRFRTGRTPPAGQATLRIDLDANGRVASVTGLLGDSTDVEAAREIVGGMRFDPALRNGVGIESQMVQTFFVRSR